MKKAISFKIPKLENESIKIQEDKLNYFYDLFHFHSLFGSYIYVRFTALSDT